MTKTMDSECVFPQKEPNGRICGQKKSGKITTGAFGTVMERGGSGRLESSSPPVRGVENRTCRLLHALRRPGDCEFVTGCVDAAYIGRHRSKVLELTEHDTVKL